MLSFMVTGAWIIGLFGVAHNLWAIHNIRWSLCWLRRTRQRRSWGKPTEHIIIFLPMFHEQQIACKAIQFFSHLSYPVNYLKIIVITTARETSMFGGTTTAIVTDFLKSGDFSNVVHFEADGKDTCKADQLNQAI